MSLPIGSRVKHFIHKWEGTIIKYTFGYKHLAWVKLDNGQVVNSRPKWLNIVKDNKNEL